MAECCICGKTLCGTAWVCVACERRYKLPKALSLWPEWAKALKHCEEQDRRYWRDEAKQIAATGNEKIPSLRTRTVVDTDSFPLSPYDSDADNAAYRRANDLPDPDDV